MRGGKRLILVLAAAAVLAGTWRGNVWGQSGGALLEERSGETFPREMEAEEPDWVTAWLSKREEKAEKKERKEKSETPVDEAAQAKRQAVRHQKVLAGIDDLQIWMKDLLRNGLLNIPERAYTLFEPISRRMIDAQAG